MYGEIAKALIRASFPENEAEALIRASLPENEAEEFIKKAEREALMWSLLILATCIILVTSIVVWCL